jgi:hypothetical protein
VIPVATWGKVDAPREAMKFFDPVLNPNFFGHLIADSAHVTIRQASPLELRPLRYRCGSSTLPKPVPILVCPGAYFFMSFGQ